MIEVSDISVALENWDYAQQIVKFFFLGDQNYCFNYGRLALHLFQTVLHWQGMADMTHRDTAPDIALIQ